MNTSKIPFESILNHLREINDETSEFGPEFGNEILDKEFNKVYENIKNVFNFNNCDAIVYSIMKYVFCHSMSISFQYSDRAMIPSMCAFGNGEYEKFISLRKALSDYFESQIIIGKDKKDA